MSPERQARRERRIIGVAVMIWLVLTMLTAGGAYYLVGRSQQLVENAHNPLVCVTRSYIEASRARSDFIAKHDPSNTRRAAARQAVASADTFLAALITLPRDYDCRRLLKH